MATSNKRRRELARKRYERQVANWHARRRRNMRVAIGGGAAALVAAGVAVVLILALSGSPARNAAALTSPSASPGASASSAPSAPATTPPPDPNCVPKTANTAGPHPSWAAQPSLTIDTKATYAATLTTNCGTITFTMDASKAPHTVNSFVFLAGQRFFDNSPCPRLVTDSSLSVLQCGDPTGSGSGGPGYTIPDENLPTASPTASDGSVLYPAGTVAMANGGPNTGGSQFFLVYADSHLGPSYTVFGHITSGLQVLQQIAAAGQDNSNQAGGGMPYSHPVLETVTAAKS